MKIKILVSAAGIDYAIVEGEIREDLPDEICKDLIKAKFAEHVAPKKVANKK